MSDRAHNPLGYSRERRRLNTSLAVMAREIAPPQELIERLYSMACGIDPVTRGPVDSQTQLAAIKLLLERQFGMPTQYAIVQADVRNELAGQPGANPLIGLSLAELNARRQALLDRGITRKVIDAAKQQHPDNSDDE